MIKECTHDYAVAVFRFYAECGCPTDEQLQSMICREAELNHDDLEIRNKRRKRRLLTEADLIDEQIRSLRTELKSYIDDIAAVNEMLAEIGDLPLGDDKLRCIRYIYFNTGTNLKARGSMSAMIQRCVVDTNLNESFIYRSLRQARDIFAEKRGLSGSASGLALKVFGTDIGNK